MTALAKDGTPPAASDPQSPLCIIAGEGQLPVDLAAAVSATGRGVVLAEMAGHRADNPGGHEVIPFRVERLGRLFRTLRARGVTDVVMAGAVHRPKLDPLSFDLKTLSMAPYVVRVMKRGDDGLLRAVIGIFEREGFIIRGAYEFLSDLVAAPGPLTTVSPSAAQVKDAARAQDILTALGGQDVAQACVVARGLCLGIESIYGTDALLAYVAAHRPDRRPETGGVFAKIAKPEQDLRVDMPVIGPDTIERAAAAGLDGVWLDAGRVMILNAAEVRALAESKGICVWAS